MKNPKIIPIFPFPMSEGNALPLAKRIMEVSSKENLYCAKSVFAYDALLQKQVNKEINEHLKMLGLIPKGNLLVKYYGGIDNEYVKPNDNSILTGIVIVSIKDGLKKLTLSNPYLINNNNLVFEKSKNPYVDFSFMKSKGDLVIFDSRIKFDIKIDEEEMVLIFDVILNSK